MQDTAAKSRGKLKGETHQRPAAQRIQDSLRQNSWSLRTISTTWLVDRAGSHAPHHTGNTHRHRSPWLLQLYYPLQQLCTQLCKQASKRM